MNLINKYKQMNESITEEDTRNFQNKNSYMILQKNKNIIKKSKSQIFSNEKIHDKVHMNLKGIK